MSHRIIQTHGHLTIPPPIYDHGLCDNSQGHAMTREHLPFANEEHEMC